MKITSDILNITSDIQKSQVILTFFLIHVFFSLSYVFVWFHTFLDITIDILNITSDILNITENHL
jgi:hypothetical protein